MGKSVGVVTFFNYNNFGAALQSYGLSQILQGLGHEVSYIDYTCPFIANTLSLHSLRTRGPVTFTYTVAGRLFYLPRRGLFDEFRTLIPHTAPVNPSNIHEYADRYDAYVAGSDQIWNAQLTDFDKTYFLDFVKDPAKRFSYATSFGGKEIDESRRDAYAELLRGFNAISVRESYGVELVKGLSGKDAAVTTDPTLLLRRQDWERVASPERYDRRPYILVYQLGFSGALIKQANDLRKRTGLPVRYIPFPLGGYVPGRYQLKVGPREWLAQFRDAAYVVTDSFHGIVFSLLFEKQFVVVANGQHKNQRVINLLGHLGLSERIVEDGAADIDAAIDYEAVNAMLEQDRRTSIDWLKTHI